MVAMLQRCICLIALITTVDSSETAATSRMLEQLAGQAEHREQREVIEHLGGLAETASTGLEAQLALLTQFVELRNVTGNGADKLKDVVKHLNETLFNQTFPQISVGHGRDQQLLNGHAAGVAQCNTDMSDRLKAFQGVRAQIVNATASRDLCRKQESNLEAEATAARTRLTSFLNTERPPNSSLPGATASPVMESFASANLAWFQRFNNTYEDLKANMTTCHNSGMLKEAECNQSDAQLTADFCKGVTASSTLAGIYNRCRTEALTIFNTTLADAQANRQERIASYKSLMRIQCFLNALLTENDTESARQLSSCNETASDVTSLDLVVPGLAPYLAGVVADLDLKPPPGVHCSDSNDAKECADQTLPPGLELDGTNITTCAQIKEHFACGESFAAKLCPVTCQRGCAFHCMDRPIPPIVGGQCPWAATNGLCLVFPEDAKKDCPISCQVGCGADPEDVLSDELAQNQDPDLPDGGEGNGTQQSGEFEEESEDSIYADKLAKDGNNETGAKQVSPSMMSMESDASNQNQLCKVSICSENHYHRCTGDAGATFETRGIRTEDLRWNRRRRGQLEDEVSSILVSDGCKKVQVIDEDNDGDELTVYSPGWNDLPGDFDNDVMKIHMYAKIGPAGSIQKMSECKVTLYHNDNYGGGSESYTTKSFSAGRWVNPSGSMQDGVSSVKISEGCSGVKLYDEDNDGDEMWINSNRGSLPGDFDDDVRAIQLYARDNKMHPIQGRCPSGWEAINGVGTALNSVLPSGLKASFWWANSNSAASKLHSAWGKTPDTSHLVSHIDFPATSGILGGGNLPALSRNDHFSIQFSGLIKITRRGQYTFYTTSDDGSKLYVDNKIVVGNDGNHPMTEKMGSVYLGPGYLDFKVQYFEGGGGAGLQVHYKGPDTNEQKVIIPQGAFFNREIPVLQPGTIYGFYSGSNGRWIRMSSTGMDRSGDHAWQGYWKWEKIVVVDAGGGQVGLWSPSHGRYVTIEADGRVVRSNPQGVNNFPSWWSHQRFVVIEKGDSIQFYNKHHKRYLKMPQSQNPMGSTTDGNSRDTKFKPVVKGTHSAYSRKLPIYQGVDAFNECHRRNDCCAVSETADGKWQKANVDSFLLTGCDIRESGSDNNWWASCVKIKKKPDMCGKVATHTEHSWSWPSWEGVSTPSQADTVIDNLVQKVTTSSGAFSCVTGQQLLLTSHRNAHLTDTYTSTPKMSGNKGSWERWRLEDAGDGKYYIISHINKQLTTVSCTDPATCVRTIVGLTSNKGASEKFSILDAGNGKVLIKSSWNTYLEDDSGTIRPSLNKGGWQQWTITKVNGGSSACTGAGSLPTYVLGTKGTTSCPAGTSLVTSKSECQNKVPGAILDGGASPYRGSSTYSGSGANFLGVAGCLVNSCGGGDCSGAIWFSDSGSGWTPPTHAPVCKQAQSLVQLDSGNSQANKMPGDSCSSSAQCACGFCSSGKCYEQCSDAIDGTLGKDIPRKNTYFCDYGPQLSSEIHARSLSAWGSWGNEAICRGRGGIVGARQAVEVTSGDQSGLNRIQMKCEDGQELDSRYQNWGRWSDWKECNPGHHVVAYRLKSVSPGGDDTSAHGIILKCSDGQYLGFGNDHPGGTWMNSGQCPANSYACGFKSQVEGTQFWGDDTAMGDMRVRCCTAPKVQKNVCEMPPKLITSVMRSKVTAALKQYSRMSSSAEKMEDILVDAGNKEIIFLALNAVSKKYGEGVYSTNWGASLLKNYKEDSCRQKRSTEGLPPPQLPGDCASHNLYLKYLEWYNSLPIDVQNELIKYGMAAIGNEIKFDVSNDGKDVYYPWQDCYGSKDNIKKALGESYTKLQSMFATDPKLKKQLYNFVINAKPELCQWRAFVDAHAKVSTMEALAEIMGNRADQLLIAMMKQFGTSANDLYKDLGAMFKLLTTFTFNAGAYPEIFWYNKKNYLQRTNMYMVQQDVASDMHQASMLVASYLAISGTSDRDEIFGASYVDSRIGTTCAHNSACGPCGFCSAGRCFETCSDTTDGTLGSKILRRGEYYCDYKGRTPKTQCRDPSLATQRLAALRQRAKAADPSLTPDQEIQAAAMLNYLEQDVACDGLPEKECQGSMKKDLETVYAKSANSQAKAASLAAAMAVESINLGGCLNNQECERRNAWKKTTGGLTTKLAGLQDAYKHEAKVAMKSSGVVARSIRYLFARKAAKKQALAARIIKATGSGARNKAALVLGTTEDLVKLRTFSQLAKLYGKSVRGSVRNGVKLLKSGKFLTSIATKVAKSAASGIKSVAKVAAGLVKNVFSRVMIAVTIWGIVTDIQDMIDYFDSGQIALGVFATISLMAGCFALVASVASLVAAAAGASFAAGTAGGAVTGPFAPLVGACVAAIAALGVLIVSLLNPPPGNQDFGDQLCCFTYRTGIAHKYLKGLDNPTSRYKYKSDSGCHDYADLLQVLPGLPGPNRTQGSSTVSKGEPSEYVGFWDNLSEEDQRNILWGDVSKWM